MPANYLYKVTLYKDTSNVAPLDPAEEEAKRVDFENNFKSQSLHITDIIVAETSFEVSVSYSDFKLKVDGSVIKWSDVKFTEDDTIYTLYLLSTAQL